MAKEKDATSAELAILSILAEGPMHGYGLEQIIQGRNMREWTQIGFSSIYYILNKLMKLGWAEKTFDPGKSEGPPRQIYRLTEKGRRKWKDGVLKALSTPDQFDNRFQLALSNIGNLNKREVVEALVRYKKALLEIQENVGRRFAAQAAHLPPHVAGMFELSQRKLQVELNWLSEFIPQMQDPG